MSHTFVTRLKLFWKYKETIKYVFFYFPFDFFASHNSQIKTATDMMIWFHVFLVSLQM